MKVSIPDELIDALEAANPSLKVVSPTGVMSTAFQKALQRMTVVPLTSPVLTLAGEHLATLQDLLGLGSTKDPETLIAAVQRIAALKIGEIFVNFTPYEWEELQRRAERNQREPAQEAEAVVRSMHDQFFSQPMSV